MTDIYTNGFGFIGGAEILLFGDIFLGMTPNNLCFSGCKSVNAPGSSISSKFR
jgi:hypothetical protein